MQKSAIKKVTFSGYKSFKKQQELVINPLTIIFGYNNTGKSAAVRLLPMLAASLNNNRKKTYIKSYIDYTCPSLRGASFRNLAYANQSKMEFRLEWDDNEYIKFELKQDGNEEESLTYLICHGRDGGETRTTKYVQSADSEGQYESELSKEKIYLKGLSVYNDIGLEKPMFAELMSKCHAFSESTHWLNAVRVYPPREFSIDPSIEIGIRYDGSGTAETIWHLAQTKSESFNQINDWLNETCGRKIDLGFLAQQAASEITIYRLETVPSKPSDKYSPIRIPILDSGEGIAQALPVVTLCAQAANNELGEYPVVLLEQPELHLHPKAIVILAEFIVKCIKLNKSVRFIIETHSESFLIALQTSLAQRDLSLKDVSIYWAEDNGSEEGSTLNKVILDEDAYILNNFPEEVFQEIYEQAKSLIKAREERGT